jgi:toxin ParE1/3/4
MSPNRSFRLLPAAARDITEIWEFIAKDNVSAAERLRAEIFDAILRLVPFPQQGHLRSDLGAPYLRFQTVREYLIAYAPEEEPLLMVAIVDGRRSPKVIAAILHERRSP